MNGSTLYRKVGRGTDLAWGRVENRPVLDTRYEMPGTRPPGEEAGRAGGCASGACGETEPECTQGSCQLGEFQRVRLREDSDIQ